MALLLSALVAGCGGGGGGDPILGTGGVTVTGTAPTLTVVAPLVQATGVGTNLKAISATFTVAMDPATLTAATFTLACPAGTPVTGGVVFYVAASKTAILTLPAATNLSANTVCTATITTGAKDATGIPLASDFTWTFTTAAGPDTTAPTVTGTINDGGAISVAINTQVGATFSEAMDPLTITSANFSLQHTLSGAAVAGTLSYAGVNLVFTPSANLNPATNYTVTVKGGASGVKDLAGNALAEGNTPAGDYAWAWVTAGGADTTAPTVSGTVNENGAINVPTNTRPGATFSEAMDPLTITAANFTLQHTLSGAYIAGVVSYTGVSAVFIPLQNLNLNTNYTVKIKGGANGVKDVAGNTLGSPNTPEGDYALAWVTGPFADITAPTVTGAFPLSRQVGIAINTRASVTFSEAMDPLTITNLNVRVRETATGAAVSGTLSYSGVTATFIPSSNLKPNTNYTTTVFGGVMDLAGILMNSTFEIGWTTGATPDTTAPKVTGAAHANGATNVAINTKVGVTFSEAMDPLTITNANVKLRETATSAAVPGILSYAGVTAAFIPSSNLKPNTNYTVTVFGNVKDLAGNLMNSTFEIGWTTGATPDTTAPTVIGALPSSRQTNVAINTKASVTFSEAMDPLTVTVLNVRLRETATGAAVPGTLSYVGVIATIVPLSNLKPNTDYTVTVFGDVKDLAGNLMNSTFEIGWITAATADTTAPTVTLVSPADLETGVAVNKTPYAFFSEWMDPLTITNVSFTLTGPGGIPVAGTVLTGGTIDNALFSPLSNLAANTTYTATITTAVEDVAGNALAANKVWTFTTAATVVVIPPPPIVLPANPTAPNLGETSRYVILASQKVTTTPTAANSIKNGDIGNMDQARATYITGFTPDPANPGIFAELQNGYSYAMDDVCPHTSAATFDCPIKVATPVIGATWTNAGTMITQVRTDLGIAYTFLAADPNPGAPTQVAPIELGNLVLTRGVYKTASNVTIGTGPLHLDAQGDPNSVFIINITGKLTTLAAGSIVLDNLAQAKNVFWRTSGITTIAAGTTFYGNVFAFEQVNVLAGANITGRLFSVNEQVTLISDTVTKAP